MYQNVDFKSHSQNYERAFRLGVAEIYRFCKNKRKPYKRKTEWFIMHEKKIPGNYRKSRKLRNDYVIYHND
jgi:hypothetical protein